MNKQTTTKRVSSVKRLLNALADNLKMVVTIGASIGTIIAACIAGFNWVSAQVVSSMSGRFDELSKQVADLKSASESGDATLSKSTTRLELLSLIQHTPTNKAEIERVATHYFCDLKGDWYMTSVFSAWAEKYNGDVEIITECHNN